MHKIDEAHGLAWAEQAGVHWMRFDAFHWDRIEPVSMVPPAYDWQAVDEASLRNAGSAGMEVIAAVKFAPAWAQQVPGSFCGPIRQDALDEYAQFLTALVKRYSQAPFSIQYWELGNEPDVDP
jgi:O-glycosyl hydrolase